MFVSMMTFPNHISAEIWKYISSLGYLYSEEYKHIDISYVLQGKMHYKHNFRKWGLTLYSTMVTICTNFFIIQILCILHIYYIREFSIILTMISKHLPKQ